MRIAAKRHSTPQPNGPWPLSEPFPALPCDQATDGTSSVAANFGVAPHEAKQIPTLLQWVHRETPGPGWASLDETAASRMSSLYFSSMHISCQAWNTAMRKPAGPSNNPPARKKI